MNAIKAILESKSSAVLQDVTTLIYRQGQDLLCCWDFLNLHNVFSTLNNPKF